MAITGVSKMWSRYSAAVNVHRFLINENYQVVHSPTDTIVEVYNGVDPVDATAVPHIHQIHTQFPDVGVVDVSFNRVSPIMHIVSVTWEGTDETVDVTDSSYKVSWTDTESDEPIDEDFNGLPIVTANREPIDGVTAKIADQVVTIERRFADFNAYVVNAYRHSTNSDTFMGYPAGMARLVRYSAAFRGGMWDVSASIQFRYPYRTTPAKAWYARVLNQGYYIKSGSTIRRALDIDLAAGSPGEPTVKPVLLKTDGTIETTAASAVWLEFQIYGSLPYNALGLL